MQKTAFDAKSTSPDAALIEAANALAAEGDVTGAIESDAGVYVAKLTSLLDREATDQKKASIIEERKQEQYDSLLKKWRKETDIKKTTPKGKWFCVGSYLRPYFLLKRSTRPSA